MLITNLLSAFFLFVYVIFYSNIFLKRLKKSREAEEFGFTLSDFESFSKTAFSSRFRFSGI